MKKIKREKTSVFSLFSIISIGITVVSVVLLLLARSYVGFADFLNSTLCFAARRIMAAFGDLFPFSLFEILIFLLPLIAIAVIIRGVVVFKKGEGEARFFVNIISALFLFYAGNVICLSISYNTTPINKRMNLPDVTVNAENLTELMTVLRDEVNLLSEEITYRDGFSDPGYTMDEISEKICDAYAALSDEYGVVPVISSRAKAVGPVSVLMSYLGISGIYTYYTGESNVNTCYPPYDVVFVAAHELAHQRGILREDEANFAAYLACSHSDDPYLRYSGALNMYEYVVSALYSANYELYKESYKKQPKTIIEERIAFSEFFEKYRENTVADISEATNNAYLQSQGSTQGTRSYGMVVDLAVAYYRDK